jgi:uncharacterized phage protein (TIGR02218 family)
MKTLPVNLEAHLQLGSTTVAHLLYIERTDAEVYAFTSHDRDITLDGVTYTAAQGMDVSGIVTSAGLAVDNLELTTLHDGSLFTTADVLSGVWRNASFLISRCNWATPSDGPDPVLGGTFGEVVPRRNSITVELRDLKQYLQQPVGIVTSITCRARLGDSACTKDLTTFTHTTTITSVASKQVFTASGLAQAADYFGEGLLTFTTGACAGLSQKIKTHDTGGVLTLTLPMLPTVTVGDSITVIAGCRKRLAEDCITKFSNVLNFQGEPHLPGLDALTKPP